MIWFPALLAALAAVCYAVARRYLDRRGAWTGIRTMTGQGKTYYWRITKNKGRVVGSWLGVDCPCDLDFKLEPEGWFHSVSKLFGFCTELQTGDLEFDRRVYVRSDARIFQERLSHDPDLHAAILKVFSLGAKSIYSTPKLLTVKMKRPSEILPESVAEPLVDALLGIKERLSEIAAALNETDPLRGWETAFVALPFFMLAVGVAGLVSMDLLGYAIMMPNSALTLAMKSTGVLALALLVIIRFVFHSSSYGHFILRNFVLFGVAATFFGCLATISIVNCVYDAATPRVYVQPVFQKYITHGSKGSINYHIQVVDWRSPRQTTDLSVGNKLFSRVQTKSQVRIVDHPGFFGLEWIGPIDLAADSEW